MAHVVRKSALLAGVILVILLLEASAQGQGGNNGNKGGNNGGNNNNGNQGGSNNGNQNGNNGNGNNGNNNGNNGNNKGNNGNKGKGNTDAASTNYVVLYPLQKTGQERALCMARGRCRLNILTCPTECPQRKPKKAKKYKGCFLDCSSRCETTCKRRRPNCSGYGSICYDPRFVGGDGVMFYFHGAKDGDFALVSDDRLHINAHFIGTRPEGRTRDFTWVQALAILFGHRAAPAASSSPHALVLSSRRTSKWDAAVDALEISWDGVALTLPTDSDAEWRQWTEGEDREGSRRWVSIERTAETNSVRVSIAGLVEMDVRVAPITAEEDRAHGYHLPADDAFAHLEMQFRFPGLSDHVDGVLGQTYRPGYVSPVKRGVPMPMMGGEDRFRVTSLLHTDCKFCLFARNQAADLAAM